MGLQAAATRAGLGRVAPSLGLCPPPTRFQLPIEEVLHKDISWACRSKMVQIAMFTHVHIHPPLPPSPPPPVYFSYRTLKFETAAATIAKTRKTEAATHGAITPPASVSGSFNQAADGQLVPESDAKKTGKKRVFFLDVNPLCYAGSTPSLRSFGRWVSIFFSQVSLSDPVIAVSSFL